MIIFDSHFHLDPQGDCENAIRRFLKAGGTHLILVNKPYRDIEAGNFQREYEVTLSLTERARGEGAKVYVALGPHPVQLVRLRERVGLQKAIEKMREGYTLAFDHIIHGRALCLGEVGRPHFDVPREVVDASNSLLEEAFLQAKDAGCAVILHTESATVKTFEELARMASKSGIPLQRVVKHYSPPFVLPGETCGLMPSIIASRRNIREALKKGTRFLMETDYIDDPERKDIVLPPDAVPLRTRELLKSGELTESIAWKIHSDNPKETYGIDLK